MIAFSTSTKVRRASTAQRLTTEEVANEEMSGLFEGAVEATEEAVRLLTGKPLQAEAPQAEYDVQSQGL